MCCLLRNSNKEGYIHLLLRVIRENEILANIFAKRQHDHSNSVHTLVVVMVTGNNNTNEKKKEEQSRDTTKVCRCAAGTNRSDQLRSFVDTSYKSYKNKNMDKI